MVGKLRALQVLEVRAFFYSHFMLREGLLMAAGYCSPKGWLLLLERGIEKAGSAGDYTSLCGASIWGDHLSWVHSQGRDLLNHVLLGRYVPVTWETDYTKTNTCMYWCTKTFQFRNTGTNAQWKWKTRMLVHTWIIRQHSWWLEWFTF